MANVKVAKQYKCDKYLVFCGLYYRHPCHSVSLFCHLASIILCALILSETLALYKSFTDLLTYLLTLY